jgi:hypothetical protein
VTAGETALIQTERKIKVELRDYVQIAILVIVTILGVSSLRMTKIWYDIEKRRIEDLERRIKKLRSGEPLDHEP